jgi:flagella basal body P-ring formation protein FlgA
MKTIAVLAFWASSLFATDRCLLVDSNRILVSHISGALPVLAQLSGDTVLGYAPAPGLTRWWKGAQLRGLALRHGVDPGAVPDICVQRPAHTFTRDEVTEPLRALLPVGSRLEVVDYCRLPVPKGRLAFTLQGLSRPPSPRPDTLLTWRGRVIFDEHRSVPFWASVRATVVREGFYAARLIAQGKLVELDDLKRESRLEQVFSVSPESDVALLVGREAHRSIPAGTAVTGAMLSAPREVFAGDAVEVRVTSGAARLTIDAKAITGGRAGDEVLVVNRQTGKRFKATVDGKSSAVVELEATDVDHRSRGAGPASTRAPAAAVRPGGRKPGQVREATAEAARPDHSGS